MIHWHFKSTIATVPQKKPKGMLQIAVYWKYITYLVTSPFASERATMEWNSGTLGQEGPPSIYSRTAYFRDWDAVGMPVNQDLESCLVLSACMAQSWLTEATVKMPWKLSLKDSQRAVAEYNIH